MYNDDGWFYGSQNGVFADAPSLDNTLQKNNVV
jgi:hypothetical protein